MGIRRALSAAIDQPDALASEFLKGNKVTLDVAVSAHRHLRDVPAFRGQLIRDLKPAIESPSDRHTPAAVSETFERGRIDDLPNPFRRPIPLG